MSLPDDYFLDVDDETLDYLERQGEDCLKEIKQSNDLNKENGFKLLNMLLLGIGSSFLLLTQHTQLNFLSIGLAAFTALWTACAIYIVVGVLAVRVRGTISSPPDLLYTQDYKSLGDPDFEYLESRGYIATRALLPVMRRNRLLELSYLAVDQADTNKKIREHLSRARIASILAPVLSMLLAGAAYFF